MGATSFRRSLFSSNPDKYNDFLVGNDPFIPTSFESIQTVTASGGETSIAFNSIPSTFTHLQIRGIARNSTGSATDGTSMRLRINGDTSTVYNSHFLYGNGSSAAAGSNSLTDTGMRFPELLGNGVAANIFNCAVIDIHNYTSTTNNKTVRCFEGWDANGSGYVFLESGLWRSTAVVTSLTLVPASGSFANKSSYALYGIKG